MDYSYGLWSYIVIEKSGFSLVFPFHPGPIARPAWRKASDLLADLPEGRLASGQVELQGVLTWPSQEWRHIMTIPWEFSGIS